MNKTDKVNRVIEAIHAAFQANTKTFPIGEDGKADYDAELVPVTDPDMLPKIMPDFDGVEFAIVWESGSPYEWVHLFPFGGIDEEFGFNVKDVSAMLPAGVWVEPINSFSLAVWFDR